MVLRLPSMTVVVEAPHQLIMSSLSRLHSAVEFMLTCTIPTTHERQTTSIGVSNFCKQCLECIASDPAGASLPVVNQIELHVGMGGSAMLAY